jgi:hypothetical protein
MRGPCYNVVVTREGLPCTRPADTCRRIDSAFPALAIARRTSEMNFLSGTRDTEGAPSSRSRRVGQRVAPPSGERFRRLSQAAGRSVRWLPRSSRLMRKMPTMTGSTRSDRCRFPDAPLSDFGARPWTTNSRALQNNSPRNHPNTAESCCSGNCSVGSVHDRGAKGGIERQVVREAVQCRKGRLRVVCDRCFRGGGPSH